MEKRKVLYYKVLCKKVGIGNMRKFKSYIESNEMRIRSCYAESTAWIEKSEFVELILLDSIFVINYLVDMHFFEVGEKKERDDFLMDISCFEDVINMDIGLLLENQLLFFILKELYDKYWPKAGNLSNKKFLDFFGDDIPFDGCKHILDGYRCVTIGPLEERTTEAFRFWHLYNARKLHDSGIKFVENKNCDSWVSGVKFEGERLQILSLVFQNDTEVMLRNIMALEQCYYPPCEAYVSSYAMLLDFLIDTEKDVELLVDRGIIVNYIGDHASIANVVNKLTIGHINFSSHYNEMVSKLNRHHDSFRHYTMVILRGVYFSNFWAGTATCAGVVLLVLTIIQTVASLIQVKQG